MNKLSNYEVAIVSGVGAYPQSAPFDPPIDYPELSGSIRTTDASNGVYPMVRESLRLLGLDRARFGTPQWNPLGELITPGNRVLIKPNFVLDRNLGGGPLEAVVTHASILRPLADYVLIALQGRGSLMIGDAPQMNCDLPTLFAGNGMSGLAPYLSDACRAQGIGFEVKDFRKEQTYYKSGIVWKRKRLPRSPQDVVSVVLGPESYLEPVDTSRLYGADYDRRQTTGAHRNQRHEYLVAAELLASDVVISVPKLKVHSKVGTTLNIKNMVGINTDKNHLAHYRTGPSSAGGDEFSNPQWYDHLDRTLSDLLVGRFWRWGKYPFLGWKMLYKALRRLQPPAQNGFAFGNWYGNDTAWRMALDLNRIVLCGDERGKVSSLPVRKYFSLIDGVIGGEGNGPLHPEAFASKVVVAGLNPLSVDWAATLLMGFDPGHIPMYAHGAEQMRSWFPDFAPEKLVVRSDVHDYERILTESNTGFRFASAPGWRGRIERVEPDAAAVLPDAAPSDPISQ